MTDLNNLDVIILIIVGISGLIALSRGLIKEVLSIVGWVLSGFAVVWFLPILTPVAKEYINSGLLAGIISAIFILILFMVIWIYATDSLIGKIRSSKLNGVDRVLGLFFGLMRAFLLIVLVNILASWCIAPEKQPEFMQKSKYFQKAGEFAKPIESLIPQETLDIIKKKTDEYIADKEKPSKEKTEKEDKKKLEADELFNRLAKPEIEKKSDKKAEKTTEETAKSKENKEESKQEKLIKKAAETFSGYNNSERENMDRLLDIVD